MGASSSTQAVDEVMAGYPGLQAAQEALYKDLHAHPELSHAERETARRVAGELARPGDPADAPHRHRGDGDGGAGVARIAPTALTDRSRMSATSRPLTPVAAVTAGGLAGLAGTAVMDGVLYARYRRGGGTEAFAAWEFPPTRTWDQASEPGQVAKRVIEGFTQRSLPDRWARPLTIATHWAFGAAAAAGYGVVAGSRGRPRALDGIPFGVAVWLLGYAVLPQAGLYKQIWQYDAETLAKDLSDHLAYGVTTATAFDLLAAIL